MAQRCDLCGKGPQFGNRVSHAHNVASFRPWLMASFRTAEIDDILPTFQGSLERQVWIGQFQNSNVA